MRTYIAPGFMELTMSLGPKEAPVRVEFTGGSSSGYGSAPARFATDDPVLQCLIEQAREYNHIIFLKEEV